MPLLSAATELLVTATGIGGIFGCSAPSRNTANRTGRQYTIFFFIAEILRLRARGGKGEAWTRKPAGEVCLAVSRLFHESLSYSMNKVGIRGRLSSFPHMAGNLSPMIGGVHDNVSEDVNDRTSPLFAFAVFVGNRQGNISCSHEVEMIVPKLAEIGGLMLTTVQVERGPHGHTLGLLLQALQPHPFSGKNVGHEV